MFALLNAQWFSPPPLSFCFFFSFFFSFLLGWVYEAMNARAPYTAAFYHSLEKGHIDLNNLTKTGGIAFTPDQIELVRQVLNGDKFKLNEGSTAYNTQSHRVGAGRGTNTVDTGHMMTNSTQAQTQTRQAQRNQNRNHAYSLLEHQRRFVLNALPVQHVWQFRVELRRMFFAKEKMGELTDKASTTRSTCPPIKLCILQLHLSCIESEVKKTNFSSTALVGSSATSSFMPSITGGGRGNTKIEPGTGLNGNRENQAKDRKDLWAMGVGLFTAQELTEMVSHLKFKLITMHAILFFPSAHSFPLRFSSCAFIQQMTIGN